MTGRVGAGTFQTQQYSLKPAILYYYYSLYTHTPIIHPQPRQLKKDRPSLTTAKICGSVGQISPYTLHRNRLGHERRCPWMDRDAQLEEAVGNRC